MENININSGEGVVNYNFRQDLRICLTPYSKEDPLINLSAIGPGEWHVTYWVGRPEHIPGLASKSDTSDKAESLRRLLYPVSDKMKVSEMKKLAVASKVFL